MENIDIVRFNVANDTAHSVSINKINSTGIVLVIQSTPKYIALTKESPVKKVDVNNDGYYDIKLTLVDLYSSSANVEFENIHEKVNKSILGNAFNYLSFIKLSGVIWIYATVILAVVFILAGAGYVFYEKSRSSNSLRSEMKKKTLEGGSLIRLHNYVTHSLAAGYSPERIEQRLLEEGWSKSIVEDIFSKVK